MLNNAIEKNDKEEVKQAKEEVKQAKEEVKQGKDYDQGDEVDNGTVVLLVPNEKFHQRFLLESWFFFEVYCVETKMTFFFQLSCVSSLES